MSAQRAEWARLFDDAAVFPPGSADLGDAVRDHLVRRTTALAPLVGPLLLPVDRLTAAAELAQEATATDGRLRGALHDPLDVGLVVDPDGLGEAAALAGAPPAGTTVTGLELKTDERWREQLAAAVDLAAEATYTVHVELTADAVADGALVTLAGTRARLKHRTGGLDAALFPAPAALAEVIGAAVRAQVPFKLTAGLHRAIRYTDPATGFPHHGFLNIAVATAEARAGAGVERLAELLATDDAAALTSAYERLGQGAGWRASFESFGTCSLAEPVATLAGLGLLDRRLLDLLPTPTGDPR